MSDYSVIVHFKNSADYETNVSALSISHAKVSALIIAEENGFNGDLSKQPTVKVL